MSENLTAVREMFVNVCQRNVVELTKSRKSVRENLSSKTVYCWLHVRSIPVFSSLVDFADLLSLSDYQFFDLVNHPLWLRGFALYKNLARVRMSRSEVKVTRDKNALSAADPSPPRVHTNGMRSLQTACSSSGRAHFVAAKGCFWGLECGVCLVNHLYLLSVNN